MGVDDAYGGRARQQEGAARAPDVAAAALASPSRGFQFSAPQSAFISVQMAPFRLVPLADPQWRRLHQAFLQQFPTARRVLTLKQYKYEAIYVECEEHEAEIAQVRRSFPFDDAESRRARTDAINALTRQANARQRVHPGAIQWGESDGEDTGEETAEDTGEETMEPANEEEEKKQEKDQEEEDTSHRDKQQHEEQNKGQNNKPKEDQDNKPGEETEDEEEERVKNHRMARPRRHTITEEESAWILTQMEPYCSVPLGSPQWRRLYAQFLARFPTARGLYSLSQYRNHTIELENYRDREKRFEISMVKYPERKRTREIGAEYQVQRKRMKALDHIKQEIEDRDRPARHEYSEDEEDDEEDAKWERALDMEGLESTATATAQPIQPSQDARSPSTAIDALLRQKDSEIEQWKANFEALRAANEQLHAQLVQMITALEDAKLRFRQAEMRAATAPNAVPTVFVEAGAPEAGAETTSGQTFVFHLHLNGTAPVSQ